MDASGSNANYLLKGFLQRLLDSGSVESNYLRNNFLFVVAPILNPDGVLLGNSKRSASGNRLSLLETDKNLFPETYYFRKLLDKLRSQGHEIALNLNMESKSTILDFHMDGQFSPSCPQRFEKELCVMLYELCDHFELHKCKYIASY